MSWLMYATRSISRTILPSSVAGSGARPEWLTIPSRTGQRQVEPLAVALEHVDDPQRVLVVQKPSAEPLAQAAVERLLADMPERRVPEVVAEPDRLDQVLVQPQRARDGPRDLRDLERMRQPGAVMIAGRSDEHLRLVLQAPERLAVDDPVAVALKRGPQAAVGLGPQRAGRDRSGVASGESSPPRERASRSRERGRDRPAGVLVAGRQT